MKIVGLMPVRNEAWCLGLSARVALKWCDALVIFDHGSTDQSRQIELDLFEEYPGRVFIIPSSDPVWNEMQHRQAMLEQARKCGATHIAIIDSDEVLTANLLTVDDPLSGDTPIQRALAWLPRGSILQLPGYNLRMGIERYHANGVWGNRWFSAVFADEQRLSWSGDKFHGREPLYPEHPRAQLKPYRPIAQGQGGVMHLWGSSERRLLAKHALYKLTERLRWPEKSITDIDWMYSLSIKGDCAPSYGTPETWKFERVPSIWWKGYEDLMKYLDVDAEPWQEAECVRIIKEHGPRMFEGLDLFGVV